MLINPLQYLDKIIEETVSHINDFTKTPTDFIRNRRLDANTLIRLILNMQGNSLDAELINALPDINKRITVSAFEQAKEKLKPDVFKHIFKSFNKTESPLLYEDKYRLFAIDGSDFTTPFNPNSKTVVPTSNNKSICQTHANILYDIQNRTYADCILQPKSKVDERRAAINLLNNLDTNNTPYIVIMDRGYSSFNMFENCNRLKNCNYVIRTKTGNTAINEIRNLPDKESDIDIVFKVTTSNRFYMLHRKDLPDLHCILHPEKKHKETYSKNTVDVSWDFEKFCDIKCRVVKFEINPNEYEVLVTNLNRKEFPIDKIKELYHLRWDIETSFRNLKYALGGINFHSKKDDFIEMEIFSHLIMFNAVSRIINNITVVNTNHKYKHSIDFKVACHITRKYFAMEDKTKYNNIYSEIISYTNPIRPDMKKKKRDIITPKPSVWFTYRVA